MRITTSLGCVGQYKPQCRVKQVPYSTLSCITPSQINEFLYNLPVYRTYLQRFCHKEELLARLFHVWLTWLQRHKVTEKNRVTNGSSFVSHLFIWWNIWIKTLFDIPESRKDRTCNATWFGNQANISWQFGGQLLWSMGSIATDSICIWGSSHSSWNCNGNKHVKKIYM